MSTHSTPPLSDGLTPPAHVPSAEAAGAETDTPSSPQLQAQPFSSTAPGYARTPPGIDATGLPSPSNIARNARAVVSGVATVAAAQATVASAPTEEEKLNEGLAASSRDAQMLIDRRPGFLQAVSRTLFPDATPPVDLSRVYVNEYAENYIGSFSDDGGSATLQRRWLASHKLTDVLSEALKTGQAPSFLNSVENNHGLFTQPNVVDASSALGGVAPADFKSRLDKLARDPASALVSNIDDYFNQPATLASGLAVNTVPNDSLSAIYGARFKAEADLRTIDGTLKPQHRALIDRVIARPNPSAEERELATTPAVYGISVITHSKQPSGLSVPGAILITDNNRFSEKTAGVLYSPARGIQTFDSLQDFQDHIYKQGRQALLNTLSDEDAAKLPARLDGLHYGLDKLRENVFGYGVKTQLERLKSDTAYAFKDATKKGITDLNELDMVGRNLSGPLTAPFDPNQMKARRYAAWIEHNRPAWWNSASEWDRTQLDQLELDSKSKAEALHDLMQERVPTLHDYAVQRIKDNLQAKYPGADIDPDTIEVTSHAHYSGRFPVYPTVSLTQFILNNVKSKSDLLPNTTLNPHWRASFTDRTGNVVTLLQEELRSLARDLNVSQGHQDLLKQRMLSSEGNDLRLSWKDSYTAQMRADAKEARLSGDLDEQGYAQVMALLDHPDSLGNPRDPLQISYLRIGNSEGGRTGASVEGPLLIAKRNAKANDRMLLYTPNALDGMNFKTYLRGMDELNRDRRLKDMHEPKKDHPSTDEDKEADWPTYFKNRVSENMKPFLDEQFTRGYNIFDRGSTQASSLRELENTLYEAHVRRQLADTQTLSKSNQQLDAETDVDLFLYAIDIATTVADITAPARAALKGLRRLFNPYKALAGLNDLPNFARIVQKGSQRPIASISKDIPKRATGHNALREAAATHRMNIVELEGSSYLAPKVPDRPNGRYLLRSIHPHDQGRLVSSGIVAKPSMRHGVAAWQPSQPFFKPPQRVNDQIGYPLSPVGERPSKRPRPTEASSQGVQPGTSGTATRPPVDEGPDFGLLLGDRSPPPKKPGLEVSDTTSFKVDASRLNTKLDDSVGAKQARELVSDYSTQDQFAIDTRIGKTAEESVFDNTFKPEIWMFGELKRSGGLPVHASDIVREQYRRISNDRGFFGVLPGRMKLMNVVNKDTRKVIDNFLRKQPKPAIAGAEATYKASQMLDDFKTTPLGKFSNRVADDFDLVIKDLNIERDIIEPGDLDGGKVHIELVVEPRAGSTTGAAT